jgi:beta-lactamase class A
MFLLWVPAVHVAAVSLPEWRPLYEHFDAGLQVQLEARLNANPEWRRLIQRKKLAVGVVDLGPTSDTPRFARVNGNQMMYAASLPKIAILLSAYVSFEDGSLPETIGVHRELGEMIRVSSNAAATRMIDTIGMTKIERVMRDPRFGFYDEQRGGGLWVGKRYASTGVRRGDPLFNVSHGATVTQVSRFYYQLATGARRWRESSANRVHGGSGIRIRCSCAAPIGATTFSWHSSKARVGRPCCAISCPPSKAFCIQSQMPS